MGLPQAREGDATDAYVCVTFRGKMGTVWKNSLCSLYCRLVDPINYVLIISPRVCSKCSYMDWTCIIFQLALEMLGMVRLTCHPPVVEEITTNKVR